MKINRKVLVRSLKGIAVAWLIVFLVAAMVYLMAVNPVLFAAIGVTVLGAAFAQ